MDISIQDYFEISRNLEEHHALFYKMWDLGVPVFSDAVPTAAVMFDQSGRYMQYHFNADFWESLEEYQRLFVICHETLHVILNHGLRTHFMKSESPELINKALDIVVNETLLNKFNFNREMLGESFLSNMCLVDTLFDPQDNVPKDECFEFYFDLLKEKYKDNLGGLGKVMVIDDHNHLPSNSQPIKRILSEVIDGLCDGETKDLANAFKEAIEAKDSQERKDIIQAGNMDGSKCMVVKVLRTSKRKWETVITKWSRQFKDNFRDFEQWAKKPRRMFNLGEGLLLPSDIEDEYREKTMIDVWFFQDTSGSCEHLAPRFFKAAASLPSDKFNVKLHCFDTKVYETDLKSGKLYGFGGTTFTCIENYIQKEMRDKKCPYPKAVFLITDGCGDKVKPQMPERWYWFLSENYKDCIPKESNTFMLKDYE